MHHPAVKSLTNFKDNKNIQKVEGNNERMVKSLKVRPQYVKKTTAIARRAFFVI